MLSQFKAERLDVAEFSRLGGELTLELPVASFPRLAPELAATDGDVVARLQGRLMPVAGGKAQPWLNLSVTAGLQLSCQRCLEAMPHPMELDLRFRFVADERQAEREDEASEEDVLALTRSLDAVELIEDEILMALPLVPMHAECPRDAPTVVAAGAALAVADPAQTEMQPRQRPFAGLAGLVSPSGVAEVSKAAKRSKA